MLRVDIIKCDVLQSCQPSPVATGATPMFSTSSLADSDGSPGYPPSRVSIAQDRHSLHSRGPTSASPLSQTGLSLSSSSSQPPGRTSLHPASSAVPSVLNSSRGVFPSGKCCYRLHRSYASISILVHSVVNLRVPSLRICRLQGRE